MSIFLDRIDSAPVFAGELPDDFVFWISVFIDSINQTIESIENIFNGDNDGLILPQKLTADIITLATTAPDGTMWYNIDHVPPVIVAKINGALVQLLTAPYP